MVKLSVSAALGAVALLAASTASAQEKAPQAASLAERLVACDVAMFLESEPDFSSQRMYAVRRTGGPSELLLGPDFLGPDRWYSEDLELGYRRLNARGEIGYDDLNAAYDRVGFPVLRQYSRRYRHTYSVSPDIRRQARECGQFARDVRLNRMGDG